VPTDAPHPAVQKLNRLMLDATLAERGALRYTPAGVPALDCVLKHASTQPEAGGGRKVECELAAVAFGDPAKALAKLPAGTAVRCQGFLARRYRTGITVALHVNQFETLDHALEGN
jgi:primosomal replication protein N